MSYDAALAARIRKVLASRKDVVEREMFGGIAFMVRGHMAVGIIGEDLMARVGPEAYEASLELPGARPMDFTGRPMKGYLYVAPEGVATLAELAGWVKRCTSFVESLPAKKNKKR